MTEETKIFRKEFQDYLDTLCGNQKESKWRLAGLSYTEGRRKAFEEIKDILKQSKPEDLTRACNNLKGFQEVVNLLKVELSDIYTL